MINLYKAKITDFTQADYANQYSLLECAIREKIDVKKHIDAKKQSLAGYILLFRAIDELYSKKDVKISFNEYGKPLCDCCFFSISHSKDYVVCVVSDEQVGIDVQQIRTIEQRTKYKFFNQKENDYVNQNAKFSSKRYIEIFTKKEAAIKMLGLSLTQASMVDTFSKEYFFETSEEDGVFLTICRKNSSIM